MSSAGLIYRHFGKEVITNAIKEIWGITLDEAKLEKVYQETYKKLILEIDCIDNGISEAEDMRYNVRSGISSRVARLNSNWNAPKEVSQHV